MTAIVVGSSLKLEFASLSETVEVRDDSGNLLGFFAPASKSRAELLALAHADFDREEIARRKQNTAGAVTTAELLARLTALEESQ